MFVPDCEEIMQSSNTKSDLDRWSQINRGAPRVTGNNCVKFQYHTSKDNSYCAETVQSEYDLLNFFLTLCFGTFGPSLSIF